MNDIADYGTVKRKPEDRFDAMELFKFVCLLWLLVPFIALGLAWLLDKKLKIDLPAAGQIGDIFGSVNALFAGFGFVGIFWAIRLQQKQLKMQETELQHNTEALKHQGEELRLQREEMGNQRRAMEAQVAVMKSSARLSALPFLINEEFATIQRLNQITIRSGASIHELGNLISLAEQNAKNSGGGLSNVHVQTAVSLRNLVQYKKSMANFYEELGEMEPKENR